MKLILPIAFAFIFFIASMYFLPSDYNYAVNDDADKIEIIRKPSEPSIKISRIDSHAITSKTTLTTPEEDEESQKTIAEKSINELIEFQQFISTLPDNNILQHVNTIYQNEEIDQSWSSDYELFIDDYFRNTAKLKNIIPTSIECKTSFCKVSIPVMDNHEQFITATQISEALQQDNNIIQSHAIFDSTATHLNIFIPKSNSFFSE